MHPALASPAYESSARGEEGRRWTISFPFNKLRIQKRLGFKACATVRLTGKGSPNIWAATISAATCLLAADIHRVQPRRLRQAIPQSLQILLLFAFTVIRTGVAALIAGPQAMASVAGALRRQITIKTQDLAQRRQRRRRRNMTHLAARRAVALFSSQASWVTPHQ